MNQTLLTYIDGLDAFGDGRGFDAKHEAARLFVETACETFEALGRMTTPTDTAKDSYEAFEIMDDLHDGKLWGDVKVFYELIRKARRYPAEPQPKKTLRVANSAGPCIRRGEVVRETAQFYVFRDVFAKHDETNTPQERRMKKGACVHVEPCSLCADHPNTQYLRGYED